MIKFAILFLLCLLPIMSFTQTYYRHELLEQGRSSLNVLNEYERIKNKDVDHLYVDLFFKSYEPYSVDTSAGTDRSILFFGGLDVMVNVGNTSRFVFISELFWMSSKNREYIDGDGDRNNVRYGLATDIYVGVDQRLFNFVVLQLGAVFGHSALNDSNVDTTRPGENLYTMTNVENKWRFFPTFGAYLYGFTLINFGTTVTYSIDKKNVTNSQTVVDIRFSYFIDNMGDLRIGYKTYAFMDNEESIIIEWHNLYKMISIGTEIFTKDVSRLGNIFIEIQLDLFKIFKKTSEQTRKIRDTIAANSTASPLHSDTRTNTTSQTTPEQSEKRKTPRHMKAVDKTTKLVLITKFNVARTRETANILASDKFIFGVKAGLSFSFNERFIVEGFYMRNVFEEILQFRHAVNRHGFLVRMVFHI